MNLDVHIRKNLRDFVLEVEFNVRDEVFALLGASGCGKSMTLKTIAGIETPDAGRIVLNGRTLFDSTKKINLPPQARRVGYLFQNYALFPNMTVAENILLAAVGSSSEKSARLRENLARFKLGGLENSYPHELSGGQQQRVAFARVLASHAELLLLDEPFSALDSHLKWQLELELAEVFKIYGAAILVSHDRTEVFRLADSVAIMNAGKLEASGGKHEIFQRPPTKAAAILTGCQNISAAKKISDEELFAEDWQLTLRAQKIPDEVKFIGLPAEALEPCSESGENVFPFAVVGVVEEPSNFVVTVRAADESLPLRWLVDKNFRSRSSEVLLRLPPDKILFLRG